MLFNAVVISLKERYIDSTPDDLVLCAARKFLNSGEVAVSRARRVWYPGGGSDLFLASAGGKQIFIKAKHKKMLVESRLEAEPAFSGTPALENEHAFLGKLSPSPHVPQVVGYCELGDHLFLGLEKLGSFERIKILTPPELADVYESLRVFLRELYDAGIVHTDIHEKNICFRDKTPVLIDFEEARFFKQAAPFERSLDIVGESVDGNVGDFPALNPGDIPGLTCLERFRKVICKTAAPQLAAYLKQCNFDNSSRFNLDALQERDERIYQSIVLPGLVLPGQRPVNDRRLVEVGRVLDYAAGTLGHPVDVVDLGSNMGMVSFFCANSANVASVRGLEADPRYVDASRVLALFADSGNKVRFQAFLAGTDNYGPEMDVLLLLSIYHHIAQKDVFLDHLAAKNLTCILGEFATQSRYYSERGGVEQEIAYIAKRLGFKHVELLGASDDYQRPIIAFHNAASGSIKNPLPSRKGGQVGEPVKASRLAGIADKSGLLAGGRRALGWAAANSIQTGSGKAMAVSDKQRVPYPEVTGYYIPTLIQWGEFDLAKQYASWLVSVQNRDGSFSGPGMPDAFVFDTGQVIRGLAAILPFFPAAEEPLARACNWVMKTAAPSGRLALPANIQAWSLGERGQVNEAIHLYVLPALRSASALLNDKKLRLFCGRSLDYYIQHCDLTNFPAPNMLLHFYCYIQEALFDLGAVDICRLGMKALAERQGASGMLPAYADVDWVCTPGLIQAGLVWLKLGDYERGEKTLGYASSLMSETGGFAGGIGAGATYFPAEELSWPVKFYLDALALLLAKNNVRLPGDVMSKLAGRERKAGSEDVEEARPVMPKKAETPAVPHHEPERAAEALPPLIPLQGEAVALLKRELPGRMAVLRHSTVHEPGIITSVAMALPTLLDWGQRDLALECAEVLACVANRFLPDTLAGGDVAKFPYLGLLLRAFRQPEVMAVHKGEMLRQLCLLVMKSNKCSSEEAPFLLNCFAELAECGLVLGEDSWRDLAKFWAARQTQVFRHKHWTQAFMAISALSGLVSTGAGLVQCKVLLDTLPESLLEDACPPDCEVAGVLAAAATALYRLEENQYADYLFCKAALAYQACQNSGEAAVRPDWDGHIRASAGFLESLTTMLKQSFTKHFSQFLDSISERDGRFVFVEQALAPLRSAQVLDLGCGKGRYLQKLLKRGNRLGFTAMDMHELFRGALPEGVEAQVGTMLRTGLNDASFDAVMLCEVLEHCLDLPGAVAELKRILKEGGRLVIVDKNLSRLGSWPGELPPWEQWFDVNALTELLVTNGFVIETCDMNLVYEGNRRDGLFFGICASKKAAATAGGGSNGASNVRGAAENPGRELVSVVLPTYNHLKFLPDSIGSLLRQDYPNLEIVIVNDGSTDGTGDYLASLTDTRIRVLSIPNSHLPKALNTGFRAARGTMLTWTSADNICRPNFISSLVSALEKFPQAGFAFSRFEVIDGADNRLANFLFQEFSLPTAIGQNTGMAAFLYRKSLAEQAGEYDPALEGAEDWDMWLRMAVLAPFAFVDKSLYQYRLHDNSMTATKKAMVWAASKRVAANNLASIKKLGDLKIFFPQIEECSDRHLAEFQANLLLGTTLLSSLCSGKDSPIPYLESAFNAFPDDLCARSNSAVALARIGRFDEAEKRLAGAAEEPTIQAARKYIMALKKGATGITPPVAVSGNQEGELLTRLKKARLVVDGNDPKHGECRPAALDDEPSARPDNHEAGAFLSVDPRIFLGESLGLVLSVSFAQAYLKGDYALQEKLYAKYHTRFNEEHSANIFISLIESIKAKGFDFSRPVAVLPELFAISDGAHRMAASIALGLPRIPYVHTFKNEIVKPEAFAKIFDARELRWLEAEQDRLLHELTPETGLLCRMRRRIIHAPASFGAAPFSSRNTMPSVVVPYQGLARIGLTGKREIERRFALYGLERYLKKDMELLETGCNCGFLSWLSAKHVKRVEAFDADKNYIFLGDMLKSAYKTDNLNYSVANFESFAPTRRYDFIISCAVYGWVPLSFSAFVKRLDSWLKPGGCILFESHELPVHPEWKEHHLPYLKQTYEVLESGYIDDVDHRYYQSEYREFLILRKRV
ncbi:MAG: glycosyltransferase [Deltaproteobacteria bacterium]|jgi:glycosyltransferase involved in cell wall biosynthesis/2-polyprenyl-3-methyl-5-hydroxy-6-metoxy-1,4-benzoquinol methylase/predicted Ser/Thr protein kinase|nr:glycosyltransferase [Deltaproteobacteria bacterium]